MFYRIDVEVQARDDLASLDREAPGPRVEHHKPLIGQERFRQAREWLEPGCWRLHPPHIQRQHQRARRPS